jgi:hypothetical protein
MTSENLKRRCFELFDSDDGNRLYRAMKMLAAMDFCVSTSWEPRQVSIARGCYSVGRIFEFDDSYKGIILPENEGTPIELSRVAYTDIVKYLPSSKGKPEHKHCDLDSSPLEGAEL